MKKAQPVTRLGFIWFSYRMPTKKMIATMTGRT